MVSSARLAVSLLLLASTAPAMAAVPDARKPAPAQSPPDIVLLNRVTWGANESSLAKLRELGATKWLDWQLHPTQADRLPPAAQTQIDAMEISRQNLPVLVTDLAARGKAANQLTDLDQKHAAQQAYQQAMND